MGEFNLGESLLRESESRQGDALQRSIERASMQDVSVLVSRIANLPNETQKAHYIDKLSKKLKLPKSAIKSDLKSVSGSEKERAESAVLCACFPGLVDIVKDEKGRAVYLFHGGNGAGLYLTDTYEDERDRFVPPPAEKLPFPLVPGPEVLKTYETGDKNPEELFEDVLQYLRRFSFLPEKDFLLLAAYSFLTYLQDHREISYLPMIFFYGVPERGKSRTGKALTWISYRGSHRVDLREANLFRDAENLRATLFLDMMDLWKKAERNETTDILLLRYERGARVARVLFPEKGPFNDTRYFNVFGPSIMASNEPVHRILGSRCIPFTMPNNPGRFEDDSPEKGIPLRIRLTAWRASLMDITLPDVEPVPAITGRLWDISRPLLRVARAVCPNRYDEIVGALIEKARERTEEKRETLEGLIVRALVELSSNPPEAWEVRLDDILKKVNEVLPDQYRKNPQWLGRRLKALSIPGRIIGGRSRVPLNRTTLVTLAEQYGVAHNIPPSPPKNSLNSCNSLSAEYSNTCGHEFSMRVEETHEKVMRNSCSEHTEIINNKGFHEFHEFCQGCGRNKNFNNEVEVLEIIDDEKRPS